MASAQDVNTFIKEFPEYTKREIIPVLNSFEQERIKKLKWKRVLDIITIISNFRIFFVAIMFFSIAAIMKAYNVTNPILIVLLVIFFMSIFFIPDAGFIGIVGSFSVNYNFETNLKNTLMKSFLNFFGDFIWTITPKISEQELAKSHIFPTYLSFWTNDNFEGHFKGQKVIISEISLKNEEQSVFKGIAVKISLNKNFVGQTIIRSTQEHYKNPNMQKIELEDIEFNNLFHVYTQDQVEARYLITTGFMERFKLLTKYFNTNNIAASFIDGAIILAIPSNKDRFSLGLDTNTIQQVFKDFIAILSIVEILNLDSKTGL